MSSIPAHIVGAAAVWPTLMPTNTRTRTTNTHTRSILSIPNWFTHPFQAFHSREKRGISSSVRSLKFYMSAGTTKWHNCRWGDHKEWQDFLCGKICCKIKIVIKKEWSDELWYHKLVWCSAIRIYTKWLSVGILAEIRSVIWAVFHCV